MLDAALFSGTQLADPVNWGIIGFGWVAQDYVLPGVLNAGGHLAAVADPDHSARRKARSFGATTYADYKGLVADPAVQAIYVATPNHLHRAAVEAAAVAGKAVLCEKPMAATLAEAEAMTVSVKRAGIPYGTAFDQRHQPAHISIRSAIDQGMVGTVTAIRIVYACWLDANWATDNWRADPHRAGGGALMDLAPHGLDLVEFLAGESITDIAALTQIVCSITKSMTVRCLLAGPASGILVQLHVAYNCQEALPRRRLEVVGTKGQIIAERTMGQTPGGRVWFVDGRLGIKRSLHIPDVTESPFSRQIAAFTSWARGDGDPAAFSIDRDLNTMRLVARAYAGRERLQCR